MRLKVLIADDEPLARQGLTLLVSGDARVGSIGEARNGREAVAAIRDQQPQATLFFLMGADSLHDLPTWREPSRICDLATIAVVRRGGALEPDFSVLAPLISTDRLAAIRAAQVQMPLIELSSTDLRHRAANGHSLRYRTPRAVEKYIETHGLYRS